MSENESNSEKPEYLYYIRYKMPTKENDMFRLHTLLRGQYEIYFKLGESLNSEVYGAYDRKRKEDVAIKTSRRKIFLSQETEIVKQLSGSKHFCEYIEDDLRTPVPYLITQMKGVNLQQIMDRYKPLSTSTAIFLALQMIECIETIHTKGYLHNDIKPSNFVTGLPPSDTHQIYLLDFSLATKFDIDTDKKSSPLIQFKPSMCRREDAYRILYILIELKTEVPWAEERERRNIEAVETIKRNTTGVLLSKLFGPEILEYKVYLDHLRMTDPLDYHKLKLCFINYARRHRIAVSKHVEWMQNPEKVWKVGKVKPKKNQICIEENLSVGNDSEVSEETQMTVSLSTKFLSPLLPFLEDVSTLTPSKMVFYPQRPDLVDVDIKYGHVIDLIYKPGEGEPEEYTKLLSEYLLQQLSIQEAFNAARSALSKNIPEGDAKPGSSRITKIKNNKSKKNSSEKGDIIKKKSPRRKSSRRSKGSSNKSKSSDKSKRIERSL